VEYEIIENNIIIIRFQIRGNIRGENGKKNDCLTGFHVKQEIHPNLGNTVKNCAPLTSVGESTTVLSQSDLLNIWFCVSAYPKEAKRTKNYSKS
jgi:hypothetical protein